MELQESGELACAQLEIEAVEVRERPFDPVPRLVCDFLNDRQGSVGDTESCRSLESGPTQRRRKLVTVMTPEWCATRSF